jgi:quinol---cytochrome c reductase iron-sulfur subunit, bacillus type
MTHSSKVSESCTHAATDKKVLAPQTTARLDSRAMPKDKGHPVDDEGRRLFLKLGVHGLGAGVAAVTAVPAIAYLAFPLSHDTTTGSGGFITAGRAEHFKEGVPVKVDLLSDKMDAWNRIEQVKIGSAWVMNRGGKLVAYSSVCPHLGCAIDFESASGKFKCPCHRSAFGQNGAVEDGPAPRGMDELEVKEEGGLLSIRYQRFKIGAHDKHLV